MNNPQYDAENGGGKAPMYPNGSGQYFPPGPQGNQPGYSVNPGQQVVYVQEPQQVSMSTGLILFLVGFCCAPCWWVGACCLSAQSIRTNEDRTWRMVNRIMTALSLIGIIAIIVWYVVVLAAVGRAVSTANAAVPKS